MIIKMQRFQALLNLVSILHLLLNNHALSIFYDYSISIVSQSLPEIRGLHKNVT